MYKTAALVLAQEAEQRKEEIETLRNIPEDIIARVKQAGLVRLWTAKAYEGPQLRVSEAMQTLQPVAYHNGSLAWVIAVTNCTSLFSGYFPAPMSTLLFAPENAMLGGFAGPAGSAEKVAGGLKVSGNWSWGSGISHCSHIVGGVRIMQGSEMVGTAVVFFEPGQVVLEDNWQVLGLKGTHSINYSANDVFIADERWSLFPLAESTIDDPLYRFSALGALSLSVSVVALGLAERALHEIQAIAQSKHLLGQSKSLSKDPVFQQSAGQIAGNYWAAKQLFYGTIEAAEREALSGRCSMDTKAKVRLAACHAAQLSLQVVKDAYQLAGGSAIWESGKLQELHRDIHVVSQHGMVAAANYRTAGSVSLGNTVPELIL